MIGSNSAAREPQTETATNCKKNTETENSNRVSNRDAFSAPRECSPADAEGAGAENVTHRTPAHPGPIGRGRVEHEEVKQVNCANENMLRTHTHTHTHTQNTPKLLPIESWPWPASNRDRPFKPNHAHIHTHIHPTDLRRAIFCFSCRLPGRNRGAHQEQQWTTE